MHARVVVEASHLAQVEHDGVGQPIDAEQPIDLGQVGQGGLGARILDEPLRALQDIASPVQRGKGQEQLRHRRGRGQPGHEALQGGDVLAAERGAQLARARLVEPQVLENAPEEIRLTHVDLEARQPQRAQPFHRHGDHLGVALGIGEADQLHARLIELAVAPDVRLVVAEHVREVREAQGLGRLAEPGGHDAGDLRRHVGSEREEPAALAVHHLEHPLLQLVVRPLREHVEVLVGGGDDLPIAPAPEHG